MVDKNEPITEEIELDKELDQVLEQPKKNENEIEVVEEKKVASVGKKTPDAVKKKLLKSNYDQFVPNGVETTDGNPSIPTHVVVDTVDTGKKIRFKCTYLDVNNIRRHKIYEWTADKDVINVLGHIRYFVANKMLEADGIDYTYIVKVEYA